MWQCIEEAISAKMDEPYQVTKKKLISGKAADSCASNNLAYRISNSHHNYFVKINKKDHLINFESEAYALSQIKSLQVINCPEVVTLGTSLDKSFIVLSYLDFANANPQQWRQLGQNLAHMHLASPHGQFGWQSDNFIGDTLQPNSWSRNWSVFFAEQRIAWQLQLLSEKSIKIGNIDDIAQVCHDALKHHFVEPCLVHGDLWPGNMGFTESNCVIFDPACYYGDREVDIAMTELFGRLPTEFYHGYQDVYPLPDSYEQRKLIYNFYHILNHANLFGGKYIAQSKAVLTQIISRQLH